MIVDLSADDIKRIYYCLAIEERDMRGRLCKIDAEIASGKIPTEQEIELRDDISYSLLDHAALMEKFKRLQNCN